MQPVRIIMLCAIMAGSACGDDGGGGAPEDGTTDAPEDGEGAGDVLGEDAVDGDAEPDDGGGPVVRTIADLEPVAIDTWMVARPSTTAEDAVMAAVLSGEFDCPAEAGTFWGASWNPRTPREGGVIGTFGGGTVLAAACFDLDDGVRLVARGERARQIWANGVPQPADVYASRRHRVPLAARPGRNVVLVRAFGGAGPVEAELYTTPDEVTINAADLTFPDLVEGETAGDLLLGVPVLNLRDTPLDAFDAVVVGDASWSDTSVPHRWIPGRAVTQVAFRLAALGAAPDAGASIPVRLRLESPSLRDIYETEVTVSTTAAGAAYRRTFRSPDDDSVQYYGVLPPVGFSPGDRYGLVLSLHGAGVEGIGQAQAYSPKDWTFIVAPTNRRPFGFDWEEWGRLDAIYALEDAMAALPIDPTQVYLTGHSMGGHGTWHVGVTTPGRFATVGPSAGWESFYSYVGDSRPTGSFGRARAHSDTLVYLGNLARRGVYIIHGSADDNVPVREGRDLYAAVQLVTTDVVYHEEPGAGHWWDNPDTPGADCVDWPPLFDFMMAHTLDPVETDFDFRTPSPAYSPRHSFVTLHSAATPFEDLQVASARSGSAVTLTTSNVRSLEIDGDALDAIGVTGVVVDGTSHPVAGGPIFVGPREGKRADVSGPFNQVFHRPFCYVYPDGGPAYAAFAGFMTSYWNIYGNGASCALPFSSLDEGLRVSRNMIYLGLSAAEIGAPADLPFTWDAGAIRFPSRTYREAGLLFVYPDGDRLSAALVTPAGYEHYLYSIVPFSSRAGLPDYLVWSGYSALAAGFFDADWRYDPALGG